MKLRHLTVHVGVAILLAWGLQSQAKEFVLYPDGGVPVSGALASGRLDWRDVHAGDVVSLLSGDYRGVLALQLQGRVDAPIVIHAAKDAKPILHGSLIFSRSSWVELEGLIIQDSDQAGVVVRDGSHHLSIRNNVIRQTGLGIWIGAAAGGNLLIEGNAISSNKTHGVAIDRVNLAAGQETVIRENRIFDNLHHGVEINGNRYVVESNEVFRNGAGLPGTSGIHCYAKDAGEGTGQYNVIRYNHTWGQRDKAGPDGNGIQLDRWCDHNQVYYNVSHDNDGAGIHVFHAAQNAIYNNTLYRNMRDAAGSHEAALKGDLVIINDRDKPPRIENVRVANNVLVSGFKGVAPLVMDAAVVIAARTENNQLHHENDALVARIGGVPVSSASGLNGRTANWQKNFTEAPAFQDAQAGKVAGFRNKNVGRSRGVAVGLTRDALGNAVPAGAPDVGAIQSSSLP